MLLLLFVFNLLPLYNNLGLILQVDMSSLLCYGDGPSESYMGNQRAAQLYRKAGPFIHVLLEMDCDTDVCFKRETWFVLFVQLCW